MSCTVPIMPMNFWRFIEGGEAAGSDPALRLVGAFGTVLGAVGAAVEYGFAEIGGGVGEVVGVDDAAAELGAADGCVGLGEEELGGALVEVEAVGGHVPAPGAEGAGVEGLAKTAGGFGHGVKGLLELLGGLALKLAGGVGDGDL